MNSEKFNGGTLVDAVIAKLSLKNDAALARTLDVAPPIISKIRHDRVPVSASLLIRLHEESGISIRELRRLSGDFREHTGPSAGPVGGGGGLRTAAA